MIQTLPLPEGLVAATFTPLGVLSIAYITIGMAPCIIVGYLASFLNPASSDLNSLTFYTLDPNPTWPSVTSP